VVKCTIPLRVLNVTSDDNRSTCSNVSVEEGLGIERLYWHFVGDPASLRNKASVFDLHQTRTLQKISILLKTDLFRKHQQSKEGILLKEQNLVDIRKEFDGNIAYFFVLRGLSSPLIE
jgi:hypothetical protein